MTHKEKAMKIFYEKFNCSQAVVECQVKLTHFFVEI